MGKNKRNNNNEGRVERTQTNGAEQKAENNEEFAQDITPAGPVGFRDRADRRADDDRTADAGRGLGITAIILSVLAFFLWPYILGTAGIIVGVISARRGSSLGWWAVGIGVIALILATFALPFRLLF
ncbi:hypothetical protein [Lihuaxuella thermophila]|uniref:DUF4190 domain-containing protein n=1 Tax=Lihuaxuella thermophila TaxID=1173111 RepID=A0A1H8DFC5_9BACL|nr:hypothetical protein [Lihuaxuella thermophila]SEN06003.1 hypothetical protein SAMN05444955_105154 [Lihuaxuella thermophila]